MHSTRLETFFSSYPRGQREDSRLLKDGQRQVEQDEEVEENLKDPVMVEQIESAHTSEEQL